MYEMKIPNIERFILLGCKDAGTTSNSLIETDILASGIFGCFVCVGLFFMGRWFLVEHNPELAPLMLTYIPIILITVILTMKKIENDIDSLDEPRPKPTSLNPRHIFLIIIAAIPATIFYVLIMNPIFITSVVHVVYIYLCLKAILILLLYKTIAQLYRVRLLRRYCPYLRTLADRRYVEELPEIVK